MKMVDMKLPKKAKGKEMGMTAPDSPGKDEYPYGLRLSLDNDQLSRLDISGDVGDEVTITAHGCITSKSENEQQGGEAERRMEIQIKHLSVQNEADDREYTDDKTSTDKRIALSQARKRQRG